MESESLDSSYLILQETNAPPTPSPRNPRPEDLAEHPLTSSGEQQEVDGMLGGEPCTYQEFSTQVLSFSAEKERKDIVTMHNLPQLMKETLFIRSQELLDSCQEKVRAKASNEEEQKKFVKLLNSVVGNQLFPLHQEKAKKLLEIVSNASLIAMNGETSLKSSNRVFQKLSPIFQDASKLGGEEVTVSYEPLDLLKSADHCSRLRQQSLQHGDLDTAEKHLREAMDNIAVCVGRAELQYTVAEQKYSEVVRANKHISVKNVETEIGEVIHYEKNGIASLQNHCEEDMQKMARAVGTLERVFADSKKHYRQLEDRQIKELEKNKLEQEQLERRLKELRDSAKKIDAQREHAGKQHKSAERTYQESSKKMSAWEENVIRLQTQTQHAQTVLELVEEGSGLVVEDFYQTHQQHLDHLNRASVESLQLYRRCLVGRIVACKFRLVELETNVFQVDNILQPKKEQLKQHRKTGFKPMADKTEVEVKELSEYKLHYLKATHSQQELYDEAAAKLIAVDNAIYKRVPDTKLVAVEDIYSEERALQDKEWENLEMQSLTKHYANT